MAAKCQLGTLPEGNGIEWKESAFLLLTVIFLFIGLLCVAKSSFYAGLNVPNALIFITDGNKLCVGFFVCLLKLSVLLIHNSAIVLAIGEHLQNLSSGGIIPFQFFFVLGFVFRLCLVEFDFL